MGQLFRACAYDIKTSECCVMDADKFHANCYSYSGTVSSIHYLLRQKPWRIMWGGAYVVIDDKLAGYLRDEDLYGLSTYLGYADFEMNNRGLEKKEYYDKVKLIEEYATKWNWIDVWDEAGKYFDWEKTKSVKYEGYLVNHTQKTAIDLADYCRQSISMRDDNSIYLIDAIPVLTETGDGSPMVFFDGISIDTTEELAGKWRGDELQIVDELPENYILINCCFADIWKKANFYCETFGVNKDGYILKDNNQNLYKATTLNYFGKRGYIYIVKVEKTEKGISYNPEKNE